MTLRERHREVAVSLFVANPIFGEVDVALAHHFRGRRKCHFSWQGQYSVMLGCHFSWRAVMLQIHSLWTGQHVVKFGLTAGARQVFCIQNAFPKRENNPSGRAGRIILASWSDLPGSVW